MNLIDLFNTLSTPSDSDSKAFHSIVIPEYSNCRIAIDQHGHPILLLSTPNSPARIPFKNFRFKYLEVTQNVECKIYENNRQAFQTFTVIIFNSLDRSLHEYFLRVSEALVKTIRENSSASEMLAALTNFVEIFRSLSDPPSKTIQGLWSELFVISIAENPITLLDYWHNNPEEKFDFNAGHERIEVKSSSNFGRIHFFSSEQLNPPKDSTALIASLFLKKTKHGESIQDLIVRISHRVINDIKLINKLNLVVSKTLGNSIEEASSVRFDFSVASDSLRYYYHRDISKIEEVHIPNRVSNVCFKSDLSMCEAVTRSNLRGKGVLFSGL